MTKLIATVFSILILSTAAPANAELIHWLAGGVAGVAVVAFAPAVLGFGAFGIVAGSPAATIMSVSAVANGGGVAAGSACALMQSAGVLGVSAKAAAIGGTIGATGAGFLAD